MPHDSDGAMAFRMMTMMTLKRMELILTYIDNDTADYHSPERYNGTMCFQNVNSCLNTNIYS